MLRKELPHRSCKTSNVSKENAEPSQAKNKRKNNTHPNEDCASSDSLSINFPRKHPRRHTVPFIKAKNTSPIHQKTKKISHTKKKSKSSKIKDDGISFQLSGNSSSATDVSLLSTDGLNSAIPSKKRPRSAPVTLKKKWESVKTPISKNGILKRQPEVFVVLKEKNVGYEDDIFENQKFNTPAFCKSDEVDDDSDISIPTPKFEFSMTPVLPKKTRKYKEAASPSDLLLARKNAKEYLYIRNEKRTNPNTTQESLSSSEKSISCEQVPEKKKLDFTEATEKFNTIQKNSAKRIQYENVKDVSP